MNQLRIISNVQLSIDEFLNKYRPFFYEYSLTKEKKAQTSNFFLELLDKGADEWNHFMHQMVIHAGNILNILESRLEIRFDQTKFKHRGFYNITFPINVSFYNCQFYGDTDFVRCTFEKHVTFNTATFFKSSFFRNCTFNEGVGFQLATFVGRFKLTSSTVNNQPVNLQGAIFKNNSTFDSTIINSNIQLSGCSCEISLPDFRGVNLESNVDLSGIIYNEDIIIERISEVFNKPKMDADYLVFHTNWHSGIYRTLKIIAENNGDFFKKQDFFALELITRAKTGSKPFNLSCNLYEIISNYGRSFTRPLLWLVFIIYSMFSINHNYSKPLGYQHSIKTIKNELFISVNNSLPLNLRFNKDSIKNSYKILNINSPPEISYQILIITQITISNILWFFFILAIRNNFRIK